MTSAELRSSLGYEPYDVRLRCLASSLVVALTSEDGRRAFISDPQRLPRLKSSRRVLCTNRAQNLVTESLAVPTQMRVGTGGELWAPSLAARSGYATGRRIAPGRSVGVGTSSRTVCCGRCAGPTFHSCPCGTRLVQRLGYSIGYSHGALALILDRLLFWPDITQAGRDRASVMRCRRSLLVGGGRCC